tara:strand:+ start:1825 stop:2739 length:915 start_codon:yes stop_codon:yes gene_type:complete
MANYNLKNEAKVYLEFPKDSGTVIILDVEPNITFSQTFTDQTYPQKTLHEQHKLHEASNIKKANPANFEFTIPALDENDLDTVFNLLVDFASGTNTLNTFNLFIKFDNGTVYKIETCVVTNGTFVIEKLENLKLRIAGEGSKLITSGVSVPSTPTRGTRTPLQVTHLLVKIASVTLNASVFRVSVELQNDIQWTPYETVNNSLNVTNAATSMYPSNFTLQKRVLAGSVGQYITSDFNSDLQQWETGVTVDIQAGTSATKGFQFDIEDCTFTNRLEVQDAFTQNYDWKMNENPTDLGTIIKFNNI